MATALRIVTVDETDAMLAAGNSAAWYAKEQTLREAEYFVCVRPKSREPFFIAEISGIERVPESGPNRWALLFERYAEIDSSVLPLKDKSSNPLKRFELDEVLRVPVEDLRWQRRPKQRPDAPKWSFSSRELSTSVEPLTIPEAKQRLAVGLGVRPEQINITITA